MTKEIKQCIFKERFRYEPCRNCDGLSRCSNYLAEYKYSKPFHSLGAQILPKHQYFFHPLDNHYPNATYHAEVDDSQGLSLDFEIDLKVPSTPDTFKIPISFDIRHGSKFRKPVLRKFLQHIREWNDRGCI